MSRNVQLTGREVTVVYLDADTKRILGFAPEGMKPAVAPGIRYVSYTLLTAKEIERYANRYREQSLRDREETSLRKLESERPFRNALRQAIIERNNQLDPWNRDLNNSLLKVMDHFYERAIESRRNAEVCITAEKYTADGDQSKVALDSPHVKAANG